MQIEDLLSRFQRVKKLAGNSFLVTCPAHNDKVPSLHISLKDNTILLKCQAGCLTEDVLKALGIEMSDLFTKPLETTKGKIVATYDYTDESGNQLFQVIRYEPKSFNQRRKDTKGEWVYNLDGVRRVLYHLPDILIAQDTIYIVEGEKDADNLWKWGLVATTSPGGANTWKPEYAYPLMGKSVVIIPDNDLAGKAYARAVAKSLQGKVRSLACVILPDAKDVTDWLEQGADIAELKSLEKDISALWAIATPDYQREGDAIIWQKDDWTYRAENIRQEKTGVHAKLTLSQDFQPLAWTICNIERSEERVRLANQVKKNDETIRQTLDLFCSGLWSFWVGSDAPELMRGEDTAPPSFYLYPYIIEGGGTILFAPPGRGKSLSTLLWAQSINAGISFFWRVKKSPVLYINLERSAQSLRRRLAATNQVLGLPKDYPLLTFNRRGQPLSVLAPAITKAIKQYNIKVIILDSISRAGYGDLTENRPVNLIIDTLSNLCDSWVAIGHTPRSDESHVYGGIMFDAGADIVVQLTSEPEANKLGMRYDIVKKNDLPDIPPQTWSFEFEEWSLKSVQKAGDFEFSELAAKKKPKMLPSIIDFILNQDSADATATEIADELGFNRANVSELLNKSGKFVKTKKVGKSQYYGVSEKITLPSEP